MTSLAPEHLADLRKSGLSDETIKACGFESVRPHDIKLTGVESAYCLKYRNLDGTRNCAERWKLFPPIERPEGTQKYHQAPGTAPSLYIPPLCDWPVIASDPYLPVVITEGEKKAAALCQHEIPTIGVAGTWNWRQRLDSGERLVISTLDLFTWKDRPVELIPDSDCWRPEKIQALSGFFALAQELISRRAHARFVVLPEVGQGKIGVDDWLVQCGGDWVNQWPMLERIALDDHRLVRVSKWWQGWKARHDSMDALRNRDAEELDIQEAAGLFTCRSQKHHLAFSFDRLQEHRGTIRAELTVALGNTVLLDAVDVSLKSDVAQTKLANGLQLLATAIPWKVLLQRACALVLRRSRAGEPSVRLDRHGTVEPLVYAVNPLIFKNKITVLYATGGMGKSTLGLFLGLCASVGAHLEPFRTTQSNVLYLDYEDDRDVHQRRVHAIQTEHPDLIDGFVSYQRLVEPLAKLTHQLVRKVHEEQISLIVVDSLLAATGGDSSAEATTKLFIALRALGSSCLLIGHVPKTMPEGQEHQSIYGSVFNSNFSRSVWEVQKQQDIGDNGMILGLFHRKSNLSRLHPPIGLKATQDQVGSRIRFESFDLAQAEELEKSLPVASRIRTFLERDGNVYKAREIAEELDIKLSVVKFTLSKHKAVKWQMVGEGRDAGWCVLAGGQK
jgi:hypothetical protein